MYLKAPDFWFSQTPQLKTLLLTPLSWLWGHITRLYMLYKRTTHPPYHPPVPVICCGALTVGGSGKTLICRDLILKLQKKGKTPHVLMRGYGSGRYHINKRVHPSIDTSQTVGDEALLLAQFCPVWVGKNRAKSAQLAVQAHADCLIMDDGFQNMSIHKDYAFIVIDTHRGLGNGHVLPAGPLRETPCEAYKRCNGIFMVRSSQKDITLELPDDKPIYNVTIEEEIPCHITQHTPLIAFSGIGDNDKFFRAIRQNNLCLLACFAFPDHYPYRTQDIVKLLSKAHQYQALLVTTRKDYQRIPEPLRGNITIIDAYLRWEKPQKADRLIDICLS